MSGIFGIVSKDDCAEMLLYGTDYHTHLGTQYGGMAVYGDEINRQIRDISQSQFKSKFFDSLTEMKGNKGIGVISAFEEQPIYINSKFGPFCIVTNGLIENVEELSNMLMKKGICFSEMGTHTTNPTELVAKMITQGEDLIDGMERMFEAIEGSCSLLLLHKDGIYCARGKNGHWPLIIGQKDDEWAVTSETAAFSNIEFTVVKHLDPGEITMINEGGIHVQKEGKNQAQTCTFLWIYTGFPASNYELINAEIVREKCGAALARRDKDIDIDLVAGIPDSGIAHAIGYANESGKPYRRPLVKYTPGYGRSYTPPAQTTRDLIAKMKLVPIKEIIKGNSILVCEDSIVRGTQLKNFTVKKLWDRGAKEIHVRPACPPLLFPCKFNLSTRSIHELSARKAIFDLEGNDIEDVSEYVDHTTEKYQKMLEWIRKDIDVTTLRFQIVDDMIEAIGLPRENLCLYCWTGETASDSK